MRDQIFEARSAMPVSAEQLFAWHASAGAFEKLIPPWQRVELLRPPQGLRDGDRVLLRVRLCPGVWKLWEAEHFGVIEGRRFCDRQLRGPFGRWEHTHDFVPRGEHACELVDRVAYRAPFGVLGRLAQPFLRRELARLFAHRHAATRAHLEAELAAGAGAGFGAASNAR
ncbi:MAG: SRPBCC family protein [Planctomycetes bacterium]|nr:SRPBCC family protein [Planctomycetota bacterium]